MNGQSDLAAAYLLAARAHAEQRRAGSGEPYISHPCAVAALVAATGADTDVVIAAVLHDVVEDTDISLSAIEDRFGATVAALVDALTDTQALSTLPMAERKAAQSTKIAKASPGARLVKLADQTANLHDLVATGAWTNEKRTTYLAGTEQIARACAGVDPTLDAAFREAADALRETL